MGGKTETYEETLAHVNANSRPGDLKITDMRFAQLEGAPYPCILMKLYTNQGITGFGEVRDMASKTYALILKGRLLGENPCNIDMLFRRIKQFGGQGRQGGGVSAVEIALWDIAGKAYGIPVYQMLGGKFRDKMRIYCDTDVDITEDRSAGQAMGEALKKRLEKGYTILKMDLGINLLMDIPGALCAPLGVLERQRELARRSRKLYPTPWEPNAAEERLKVRNTKDIDKLMEIFKARNDSMYFMPKHPFTGIQITDKGLDYLEAYVHEVRGVIGYEVPLALDHFGHIGADEIIKLAGRLEKYNIAWMEDPISVQYPEQWRKLTSSTSIPICTGENIYLAENFEPLLNVGGITVAHPDPLTAGGIFETKKIGDLAERYGVNMALHQAASPIHAMAAAHIGVATQNCWACEFHANDVPWWDDIVLHKMNKPLVNNGFIDVPDLPGLGIEELNDDVIAEHASSWDPELWAPTDEWNFEFASDGF
ncbi:MAG: mandelate racemase/muconate lactonizing enzyme family protein [Clostridiales bacterium]|jgi:L-alanine-DL-glutamate epimerase-like enolase superfamily enzyme|nr:mandelate racemase/muconate lactonizing enzyme family protein [Clostridiales bacterium]